MALGKKKSEEQGFGEPIAAETKSKKPMLIMVLVVVAVIVFTCTLAFGKKIMAKDKNKKAVVAEKGTIIPLDEFLVNLNDPGSDHFLKVSLALEFTKKSGKTAETIKEEAPRLRDAVLGVLTAESRDDVTKAGGHENLKKLIKDNVNKALGDDEVLNVYYTNFVTQ